MRSLILVAFLAAATPFASAASLDTPQGKDLIASCRAALVRGGNPGVAHGPAKVALPYVFLGDGTSCTFEPTWPPQLTAVNIGGCYECNVMYHDELLGRLNELLRRHWTSTPPANQR